MPKQVPGLEASAKIGSNNRDEHCLRDAVSGSQDLAFFFFPYYYLSAKVNRTRDAPIPVSGICTDTGDTCKIRVDTWTLKPVSNPNNRTSVGK